MTIRYYMKGKELMYKVAEAKSSSFDKQSSKDNKNLIMVVDDESLIRDVTKTILETFGYRVLTVSNGLDAIELYKAKKDEVKIILTDLNMPVMDGITMIKSILNFDSQARFIINSGLLSSISNSDLLELNVVSLLQKPFSAESLLKKINEIF